MVVLNGRPSEEEVKGEKAECKGGSFWQKPDNWNVRAGSSIDKEKVTKQTKSLKSKKDPLGNRVRRKNLAMTFWSMVSTVLFLRFVQTVVSTGNLSLCSCFPSIL